MPFLFPTLALSPKPHAEDRLQAPEAEVGHAAGCCDSSCTVQPYQRATAFSYTQIYKSNMIQGTEPS